MKTVYFVLLASILSCRTQQLEFYELTGHWSVKSCEITPASLIGSCSNIGPSFSFIFSNDKLSVANSYGEICESYFYHVQEKYLLIKKDDMVLTMEIERLNNNRLVLINKHLPKEFMINWKPKYGKIKKEGYRILLTK